MRTLAEPRLPLRPTDSIVTLPISVIIPVRNEARNLPRCLESLRGVGEVYVLDSNSSDETAEIARSFDATVVQFTYRGGWPKKRQWAMDTLPITYEWLLLLDADEALTSQLAEAMSQAIQDPNCDASVLLDRHPAELPPSLFATPAQRRRWLRKKLFAVPGSPVLFFLYKYFLRLAFLDGRPGLIYCVLHGIQFFHIKAKIYELRISKA